MLGWKDLKTAEDYIKFDKIRLDNMFKERWNRGNLNDWRNDTLPYPKG